MAPMHSRKADSNIGVVPFSRLPSLDSETPLVQSHQVESRMAPERLQPGQGLLAVLLKPGWESAEAVIPVLHKSLAALLAILVYTAQHHQGSIRIHLWAMSGLTLCLWGSITWFIHEYRAVLRRKKEDGEQSSGSNAAAGSVSQGSTSRAAVAEPPRCD